MRVSTNRILMTAGQEQNVRKVILLSMFAWVLTVNTCRCDTIAGDDCVSCIHDYRVKWYRNKQAIGDILEIYRHATNELIYKASLDTTIESISAWTAPEKDYDATRGIMVTTHFSTGSSKKFIILAEVKGKIREVLNVFSRKAGEAHALEIVDLDGDSYPEIICVASYEDFRGSNPGPTRAQIWKWFPKQARYVQVRDSAYLERLMPLRITTTIPSFSGHKRTQ